MQLKKKADLTRENWYHVYDNIEDYVPTAELEALIERTTTHIQDTARGKNIAYAWSGGKDAQTLRWLIEAAGLTIPSFIVLTEDLEYPAFLDFIKENGPAGLEVVTSPNTSLAWLRDHPEQLFPETAKDVNRWLIRVQRTGWDIYHKAHPEIDMIALGKRTQDGNWVGPAGSNISAKKNGATTWSPIHDWKHVHVVALQKYAGLKFPSVFYDTPRGFEVGTGPWAGRLGTSTDPDAPNYGWRELWSIDPTIVTRAASEGLPGAADFIERSTP